MDYKDIIARQAQKILDLEDKLAEKTETSSYWYDEYNRLKVMPVKETEGDGNAENQLN